MRRILDNIDFTDRGPWDRGFYSTTLRSRYDACTFTPVL